jgi:hypothetical protein
VVGGGCGQATSHEIAAVTRATADVASVDVHALYLYLLRSLMSADYQQAGPGARMGTLSDASRRILQEFATRYRVSPDYQAVAYAHLCISLRHACRHCDVGRERERERESVGARV